MRNTLSTFTITFLALSLGISSITDDLYAQNERQLGAMSEMRRSDPNMKIRWNEKTGTPARISGHLSERIEADAKEIALRFFQANEALFSMTNSTQELNIVDVKTDTRGKEHVKLQQMYQSLPVEGKQISVHINQNKEVQQVTGNYVPNITLNINPTTLKAEAITAALTAAKQDINPQMIVTNDPTAELIVYHFQDVTHLAWKTRLDSEEPLGQFVYYVDAHSGAIIHFYNNLKFFLDRKTFSGNNSICTQGQLPGTLVRSEGSNATGDTPLDAAHENAGTVYNYYMDNHGRDSFDGLGATLRSTAHYCTNYNNAFWNGIQMVYGDGDGVSLAPLSQSLDVVAHELTHAVTDRTSELIYENQSGALNESISDIFGVLVDPPDWMLGEDIITPGTPGDALRYMDDPPRAGDPDHMNDFVTPNPSGSSMDRACANSDDRFNGCVHFNSGIPNKAAYLMSEGGTHHGIPVLGMGREDMGKIFYDTNVFFLNQSSGFLDAREGTLDAVANIFPGDASKKCTVEDAWAAVGIGDPCGDPGSDLSILKTSDPSAVKVDEALTYTLTVTNLGPDAATGVEVTDTLDEKFSFSSATTGCNPSDGIITCNIGDLAVNESKELKIQGNAPSQDGTLTNTAQVSGNQSDPSAENNAATVSTVVIPGNGEPNMICQSPGLEISEERNVVITDTLLVNRSGLLPNLKVLLDITHSYVGDLEVKVEHEGVGPSVVLINRPIFTEGMCRFNDIKVTLDDEAARSVQEACDPSEPAIKEQLMPKEPLSSFQGKEIQGSWKLTVTDRAFADGGTLNKWCLITE